MADPKTYKFNTKTLHSGHQPDKNYGSRAVPIYQSTSYLFQDTDHAAALFNLEEGGHIYSRISNPTVSVLEERVAALEGGAAALATASGMSAMMLSLLTICSAGDHIVASSQLYGANVNLLKYTLPRFGIHTSFVDPTNHSEIKSAIKENTKLFFSEIIGNPGLVVLDVDAIATICKEHSIIFMIDGTFNTPYLMAPVKNGVNIIIHSLTKWMGGHGVAIGGVVVDGGNFDWGSTDKYPTISEPHYAMDGINFYEEFGPAAFTAKFRAEAMYNFGPSLAPMNAFHILQGLETLPLRMQRHIENTEKLLEFLTAHEQISWVRHPSLPEHPQYKLAKKCFQRERDLLLHLV